MNETVVNGHHSIAVSLNESGFGYGVVEADWHGWSNAWWVARCFVKPGRRNDGLGTRLMVKLCELLDERGQAAYLVPNPYDPTIKKRRLISFYQRFGFVRRKSSLGAVWVREGKGLAHAKSSATFRDADSEIDAL